MGLALLHYESERSFEGIPHTKYKQKVLYLGLSKNTILGYRIYVIQCNFDNLEALDLLWGAH